MTVKTHSEQPPCVAADVTHEMTHELALGTVCALTQRATTAALKRTFVTENILMGVRSSVKASG